MVLEPGKAMTPLGSRFSSSSLHRNGAARPWRFQSDLHTDLVHAVALVPLRGDAFDAGATAVHQHHVGVLGAGLVELADDGAGGRAHPCRS